MIYLLLCWRRSIRECANEICSFRTEALHEQFCLHLHLLYRMRENETNAFGPVPQTHTEHSTCKLCHWQTETSNFCKWLSWQGHFCSVSFLAASFSGHRSEAVVALDTAAPSTVVETEWVCVCVCATSYAGLLSRTIEQGGLSLICHLSRQHLMLSGEAQQVMGSSL